jgi:hypothetical protein
MVRDAPAHALARAAKHRNEGTAGERLLKGGSTSATALLLSLPHCCTHRR